MCRSSVEILGKTAVVATSSLLLGGGKMPNAAETATVAHAQEVVAVVVDDDDGDDGGEGRGLEVLSVLPEGVCPDTMRRYLDASVMM